MKIDVRILIVVTCFMATAASAVVMVRHSEESVFPTFPLEIIPPQGVATTDPMPEGLQLQASAKSITLFLPGCNITEYRDKFFLHIYTDSLFENVPSKYVNLDFDLAQEKGKELRSNGSRTCIYHKNLNEFSVKALVIGQYTTPNGQCCDITWSRTFVFDENALRDVDER